jgi:iron complex outermembrane recepter protein
VPITYGNQLEGETYGFEFAPAWQVTDTWRLSAGYSLLQMNLHRAATSTDLTAENAEGDSPEHQFHIRSFLDLPHHFQIDSALYYVDALPNQRAPGYVRLDLRLGWSPTRNLDVSVAFLNLLDPRHPEFGATSPLVTPTEIERSIYGKVTWRF